MSKSFLNTAGKLTTPFCWWTIITSSILALIVLSIIIYLLFFYPKYIKTRAKILKKDCEESYINNNKKRQFCTYLVEFTDKSDKKYKSKIDLDIEVNKKKRGKKIEIEYNPKNPRKSIREPLPISKSIIIVILLIIFIISIGTAVFYYLYRKNPIVCGIAAISQTMNAINFNGN